MELAHLNVSVSSRFLSESPLPLVLAYISFQPKRVHSSCSKDINLLRLNRERRYCHGSWTNLADQQLSRRCSGLQ